MCTVHNTQHITNVTMLGALAQAIARQDAAVATSAALTATMTTPGSGGSLAGSSFAVSSP